MELKERVQQDDFNIFVEYVKEYGDLNDDQKGIASSCISKGYDSLTDKQTKYLLNGLKDYYIPECEMCADDIPFSEMHFDESHMCSHCLYELSKN